MVKKFTLPDFGYEVELGKVAQQAHGAAWFKHGGTVVLATVVSEPTKDFPGFLPLSVDYREQFSKVTTCSLDEPAGNCRSQNSSKLRRDIVQARISAQHALISAGINDHRQRIDIHQGPARTADRQKNNDHGNTFKLVDDH